MKRRSCGRGAALLAAAMFLGLPSASCADLSLQDAINLALAQNTSLRITQKGEDTARAQLQQAKIENGLQIKGTESLDTTLKRSSSTDSKNEIGVTASYPLYTSGKAEANIDSGVLGLKAAELSTERSRENLKLDVIKAYYDALEARRTVDVRQETVDKYQDHYTNVSQLYAAGSKARIDVIRSSVELSNAAQDLIKAQNSYEVDLATLRNYLNIDRSEPLTLTDDFVYDTFDISLSDCIGYALRSRKDLLADRYTLQQKELAVKEAKAGLRPSVSLSAGTGLSQNFEPEGRDSHSWNAGVAASWNLFDSGVTRAAIDEAEAAREKAALSLEKARQDVDLAVREAYYNMREAEHRMSSTSDAVGQAQLQRWFSLAAGFLAPGIAGPRFATLTGRAVNEVAQATGKRLLAFMEDELQGRAWLLGGSAPSLADVAMVSYTSQAHLAGLPLDAYPRIAAWVARMQALPGYPVLADQLPAAEQVAA